MAKRPGSLILTFSKKNIDVRKLLESKKFINEAFVVTDYICEAIRFYEKYKDSTKFNDLEVVKRLIDERLKQFIKANSTLTFDSIEPIDIVEENVEEKPIINEIKTNINTLESNLEDIPIDED